MSPPFKFVGETSKWERKLPQNLLSAQLNNNSFHVVERTRIAVKCTTMENARALRAKKLFFIVRYAHFMTFSWLLLSCLKIPQYSRCVDSDCFVVFLGIVNRDHLSQFEGCLKHFLLVIRIIHTSRSLLQKQHQQFFFLASDTRQV